MISDCKPVDLAIGAFRHGLAAFKQLLLNAFDVSVVRPW
ncbi:MAG: hypothetical protein K0Q89_1151 [Thermomicrobiales bacterium]|jgi:hypothetical protein|nr:hypothetical protein [Thermomicrobiales bacterium]